MLFCPVDIPGTEIYYTRKGGRLAPIQTIWIPRAASRFNASSHLKKIILEREVNNHYERITKQR
jgi:hypothetical protein